MDIELVDDVIETDVHNLDWSVTTEIYKTAIDEAIANGEGLLFICPDFVIGDGSLSNIGDRINSGEQIVLQTCPRLSAELFVPHFLNEGFHFIDAHQTFDVSLPINGICNRDLTELGLKCFHPVTSMSSSSNDSITTGISQIHYRLDLNNAVFHNFHWHPIYLKPSSHHRDFDGTIDGGLTEALFSELGTENIGWVRKSEEACIFELSGSDKRPAIPETKIDYVKALTAWGAENAANLHLLSFQIPSQFGPRSFTEFDNDAEKIKGDVSRVLSGIATSPFLTDRLKG